ncbi:hypothetical protein Bealeia1_01082 [Candidatus Bealeia paramacronuclearis]|uniref:Uncharacterized protein n=1 Tax=Candidatus Bealeia paramacronuclearis TaxID=1921001 RepID=A0ABZ2C3I2_9PROT|nr:hypothetical protein [Candidatus Bealeia paramacronuclearis]
MKIKLGIVAGLILGTLSNGPLFSAPSSENKASALMHQIEGVYKYHFKNGLVDGSKYDSENILEVVPVTNDILYFKTSLQFFNGHSCGLYGLATYQKDGSFLYNTETEDSSLEGCQLKIIPTADTISFQDGANGGKTCRNYYCGARGDFDGVAFKMIQRHPIGYMKILKDSQDYKDSVKDLKKD